MGLVRHIFIAALIGCGVCQREVTRVTPTEKVITLLANLKAKVEAEGTGEAASYEKFSCFCKSGTQEKSDSITGSRDKINLDSASMAAKTAEQTDQETELGERKVKKEVLLADIKKQEETYQREKAMYEEKDADLSKAIAALKSAEKSLQAAKPSFLAIRQSVANTLALADVLNMVDNTKRIAIDSLLQVDPTSADYKYHSSGIIDTIKELLVDFKAQKKEADDEFAKTTEASNKLLKGLREKATQNDLGIGECEKKINILKSDIATLREGLVIEEAALKDDEVYMRDLTERCELRAKEWDQRSVMRSKELGALAGALEILRGTVSETAAKVERAFVQVPSFVQVRAVRSHEPATMRDEAISLLQREGRRLASTSLASLANHVVADPFANVIRLIQKLVERLIAEATSEATKKGFCDTEVGKAEEDRDFRMEDVKALSVKLAKLQATRDVLSSEISTLSDDLDNLNGTIVTSTGDRKIERRDNLDAIANAREGLAAVKTAIKILSAFYAEANKAALVQWSPVQEDLDTTGSGAGFDGAYTGAQKESGGIIGLLQVLQSDFERKIRTTKEAEAESHADFVKFDRSARSDFSGKTTKKQLNTEDHEETVDNIDATKSDLQTQMDLLDLALKRIEALKPTCIDTGMSFEDRSAKRDEEIAALKSALVILAPPTV